MTTRRSLDGKARAPRFEGRGFTLIEAMIVVVIMAVLATLAVAGYRKLTSASRASEARDMVSAIGLAQRRFYAENGVSYANISAGLDKTYPHLNPGPFKTAWGADCTAQCNSGRSWKELPLKVAEPQMFGYATTAGPAGATSPSGITINGSTMTFGTQRDPWYIVSAVGDTNGDGTKCKMYSFSWDTRILVENEGE